MTRSINDYVCHYGRSKKNGAPGIGTGNWRRTSNTIKTNARRHAKDIIERQKGEWWRNPINPYVAPDYGKSIRLPQGTKLERVSVYENDDDDPAGHRYVNVSELSSKKETYTVNWAETLRAMGAENVYKHTYIVDKGGLVSPSKEERAAIATEIAKSLAGSFDSYVKEMANTIDKKGNPIGEKRAREILDDFQYAVKRGNNSPLNPTFIAREFSAAIARSPSLMTKYIEELKKRGFSAVFDDNSIGNDFIIIDRSKIKEASSEKLQDLSPFAKEFRKKVVNSDDGAYMYDNPKETDRYYKEIERKYNIPTQLTNSADMTLDEYRAYMKKKNWNTSDFERILDERLYTDDPKELDGIYKELKGALRG